jgi:hypothetical protein
MARSSLIAFLVHSPVNIPVLDNATDRPGTKVRLAALANKAMV